MDDPRDFLLDDFDLEVQVACPECGIICDPGDSCPACGKVPRQ